MCFLHYIRLLTVLTAIVAAKPVFGQQFTGSGRMSLGSTWTRHSLPARSPHQVVHSSVVNRQFFGGVTVGRGFTPFYYPCLASSPSWIHPGLFYPSIWSAETSGFRWSVNYSGTGSFFRRFGPVLPLYYDTGFSGYYSLPSAYSGDRSVYNRDIPSVSVSKVNKTPPAKFSASFGRSGITTQPVQTDFASVQRKVTAAIEMAPLAGEFAATAAHQARVTTLDRIESQRLQNRGDQALQDGDPELARTFYQSAIQAASNRQTPWLRIAWVYVVQRDFARAAAALKRAILIHDAAGGGWVTAKQLVGDAATNSSWLSHNGLWIWLQDHPSSADRLLLAAGYELFLGNRLRAQNFLELALSAGASPRSYETLTKVSENLRSRSLFSKQEPEVELPPRM